MTSITARYDGQLRCSVTHRPSGQVIRTDTETDDHPDIEGFAPTDLVAASLSACILTVMAVVAERSGYDLTGATVDVDKQMVADPHRRIGRVSATVTIPGTPDARARQKLERAAHSCAVHRSLRADIDAPIDFVYPDVQG